MYELLISFKKKLFSNLIVNEKEKTVNIDNMHIFSKYSVITQRKIIVCLTLKTLVIIKL